jgi:hypothetical protein
MTNPPYLTKRSLQGCALFLVWLLAAATSVLAVTPPTSPSILTSVTRGGAAVKKPVVKVHPKKRPEKVVKAASSVNTKKVNTSAGFSFPTEAILGSIAMALVERVVKKVFVANGISFPAQLAGCIFLFFALLIMDGIMPGSGQTVFEALGPGTALLTKWLPVFFVPGLAMLPLAPSAGSGIEVRWQLRFVGRKWIFLNQDYH